MALLIADYIGALAPGRKVGHRPAPLLCDSVIADPWREATALDLIRRAELPGKWRSLAAALLCSGRPQYHQSHPPLTLSQVVSLLGGLRALACEPAEIARDVV